MKKLKFDYIKIGPHKRPAVNTPALIDSGADFNVFPLSIAKDIGLKLKMIFPQTAYRFWEKPDFLII